MSLFRLHRKYGLNWVILMEIKLIDEFNIKIPHKTTKISHLQQRLYVNVI